MNENEIKTFKVLERANNILIVQLFIESYQLLKLSYKYESHGVIKGIQVSSIHECAQKCPWQCGYFIMKWLDIYDQTRNSATMVQLWKDLIWQISIVKESVRHFGKFAYQHYFQELDEKFELLNKISNVTAQLNNSAHHDDVSKHFQHSAYTMLNFLSCCILYRAGDGIQIVFLSIS